MLSGTRFALAGTDRGRSAGSVRAGPPARSDSLKEVILMSEEPHPNRPNWERAMQLLKLLVSAIEPVAQLLRAIGKI